MMLEKRLESQNDRLKKLKEQRPKKTRRGLYCVANTAVASCVLSPSSARKSSENPVIKAFP